MPLAYQFVQLKPTSPALLSWDVVFLRTPQKSHLVLDLVHNIFCKQNLVASNSLLGNINLLENNNFTWSATSVGSGKILYGIMKWELSKRCAEFESYRHICMSVVFAQLFIEQATAAEKQGSLKWL